METDRLEEIKKSHAGERDYDWLMAEVEQLRERADCFKEARDEYFTDMKRLREALGKAAATLEDVVKLMLLYRRLEAAETMEIAAKDARSALMKTYEH